MTSIVLQLLIFFVALAFVMLGSMFYTRKLIDTMVVAKHRDLEAITSTGSVPSAWSKPYLRRMIRLREAGRDKRLSRLERKARKTYLKRLSRLSGYVRRTRFVESEDVRKQALRELHRLDREWRKAPDEPFS